MDKLSSRDQKIIWHPFTQSKTAGLPISIIKASGSYIYDENGKKYLDLISSWWVNLHGHAHPKIAKSIYEQALQLEHVIFAGFTHEPAVKLCEDLAKILPAPLARFFFSDNGSTSVEVALKMAYQYWYNKGEKQKTLFLSFEGGYHGDSFGAMSVGAQSGFHNIFQKLLFKVLTIPYPATWDDDSNILAKTTNALAILDKHLAKYSNDIAAIILEPLIQGASGMRICSTDFVYKVIKMVRKHGILVIFDEVMTGFGRTGTNFALEQIELTPDFLCLSKGITGGFLPLALTITTNEIYQVFSHDEWKYALAHGHSYTANPLACSAAITSLELLLQDETKIRQMQINQIHKIGIAYLKSLCKDVINTRILGTIAAFELQGGVDARLKAKFLEHGLLLRPLSDTIYLLPPYSITKKELEGVYEKLEEIIAT